MLRATLWSLFFCLILSSCFYSDNEKKEKESDNISLALNEVQEMQTCIRKAKNKDFYLHKYQAEKLMNGYKNKENNLSQEDQKRLVILRSEFAFQHSDYLYQIGKRKEAQSVMFDLATNTTLNITTDTVQWLNYLYHLGKVCYEPYYIYKNKEKILNGYDCLIQCYIISIRRGYSKYEALSMQALSQYLRNDSVFTLAKGFDRASLRYINDENTSDSLLAGNLAERAVNIFMSLNDQYLTADAWRNLALCYFDLGDAASSIECLHQASAIPATSEAPDLLAKINEQFSMSYAALDDKHYSDFYRNAYLDLQDSTRQDRMLEARVVALQNATNRIWKLVAWAFLTFLLLGIATFTLTRLRKRKEKKQDALEEELETMTEELQAARLQYSNEQRLAVEQRAHISIINGMLPLIDRMKLAISKTTKEEVPAETKEENLAYASELSEAIDTQNAMLTQWIKLRQGSIAPKIETFYIQDIFNIVAQSSKVLLHSGINLNITPSEAKVKADRTLTLFLVNTLTDNARKATPEGGTITVSCQENTTGGYAEVSVSDTGKGMTDEQLAKITDPLQTMQDGATHGFGLVNCKGIIDRYKKISSFFSVCTFSAESTIGKGTTIRFRLPLVTKLILLLTIFCCSISANASGNIRNDATRLADSLYECNVAGRYADAMLFADSCYAIVQQDSTVSTEIRLSLYNETAVAALALHQWNKYRYFNYLYTMLYKQCTADTSLTTYSQTMERNELIANIAMLVVLMLIISLLPIFWFVYLRHVIKYRKDLRMRKALLHDQREQTQAEYDRLHVINNITANQLSALKHETMYYPTRIRHLIAAEGDTKDIEATVNYYRELYAMLSTQGLSKQTEAYSFRISPMPLNEVFPNVKCDGNVSVLANAELMAYLRLLMKRHNGGKTPEGIVAKDTEKYVLIEMTMSNALLTEEETARLFSTETKNSDFLIMRQIMRETGNTAVRYASGISATTRNGMPIITITLPKNN